MSATILVLRPQPGAARTAARAAAEGWQTMVAPLFTIVPLAWEPPALHEVDSLLLTSANAIEQAGPGLNALMHLPAYAVGEATAAAARKGGIEPRRVGSRGVQGLVPLIRGDSFRRPLHLAGADRRTPAGIDAVHRTTFRAEAVEAVPAAAADALAAGAVALIHSPRAAALLAALLDQARISRGLVSLVAISPQALAAAGGGWRAAAAAAEPSDAAMLAAGRRLCEDGR